MPLTRPSEGTGQAMQSSSGESSNDDDGDTFGLMGALTPGRGGSRPVATMPAVDDEDDDAGEFNLFG